MELNQNVNIHNRFDIEVKNIKTNEIKKYTAYNIVLDQMWNRLCNGNNYFLNIHFGTGSGTPVASRTGLFAHLGTKSAVNEELIKAVPLSTWKRKIVLNPEEYVGQTITEVGIAYGSGTSSLVTHAMLKDSEGNPISISKSDTDVIIIYATVFVTFGTQYENLKYIGLPNNNTLINYLIGGGSAPDGTFGLCEIINPYERLGSTANAIWTSDVPNKKRKTNVNRFGIATGNGNVKILEFTNLFTLKLPQVGVFTGQTYSAVPIGVGDGIKKEWNLPSANINISTIDIKIDGVVDTLVTKSAINSFAVKRPNPSSLPPSDANGVALTPDGLVMAVTHYKSPYVTTYDWSEDAWVKRPNPSSLPPNDAYDVALTHDGLVMAVAHRSFPYVTTYDWSEDAWVKRSNPSSLPPNTVNGVALTPDGLVMAVAHNSSPYVTTYDWSEDAWVKRSNPSSLPPPSDANGVALTPDGLVMAVAHNSSPYVTTYDWSEDAWVKRPNPSSLPPNTAYDVALTHDGLVMAVVHNNSPYVTTYDWSEDAWVKRPNPSSLPPSDAYDVALTHDGLVMAVVHNSFPYVTTYENLPMTTIKFDTPPAEGAVTTADYTVDGIHKTDQYVIDVSFAIQFGEGV